MDEKEKIDILIEGNEPGAAENTQLPALPPPEESSVVKKPSLSKRIATALLSEDYPKVLGGIYKSIIDPAIKQLAVEAFKALVYHGKPSNDISPSYGYTPYESFSGGSEFRGSETYLRKSFGEIQFRSKESADAVLSRTRAYLQKNGLVCVSDYYQIANHRPEPSYFNYGWTNLNGAFVSHYRDAKLGEVWYINFPEPIYVDRVR